MESSTSCHSYVSQCFTQESHWSLSSKTWDDMATHALQPIQVEFTWGFRFIWESVDIKNVSNKHFHQENIPKKSCVFYKNHYYWQDFFSFSMDKLRVWNTEIGIFDVIIRSLIVLLPFTTLVSVFTSQKLWIPGFTYVKELLLLAWVFFILYKYIKKEFRIHFGWIDGIITWYVLYLIFISLWTTGLSWIIYGGRYDFEFIIMFLLAYHGAEFLEKPTSYYIKLFLVSTGIMIFLSWLLKFPLSEDLLLYVWYSGNPSSWQFGSVPPIFHGIDWANVRRFQGVLDGPNTMGAFLILFSGMFAYFMRNKRDWYFVSWLILFFLIIMVIYTYSRSALLGIIAGYIFAIIMSIRYVFQKYKKQFIAISIFFFILAGLIYFQYSWTLGAIIGRAWSTKWHLERMKTSIERFVEHPFGQWLGSSGPAYRYTKKLEWADKSIIEKEDAYYIPESWYLQQLVEWGIIGGITFILFMFTIFWRLTQKHIILWSMFVAIAIMNLFLHTFESAPFSLSLFLLIGILLSKRAHGHHVYER